MSAPDPSTPAQPTPLLGRYTDPLPIQSRAAFHLLSVRRVSDGQRCVLVLPGARAQVARVAAVLAEVAAIHACVDHPLVPRVSAHGLAGDTPFLEFDIPASRDALDMTRCMAESGDKLPYEAADGFIVSLRQVLEVAHATPHPDGQGPILLGRFSHRNVLFADDGRWWLIGLGRNFLVENELGQLDGTTITFHAPELPMGVAPTPMSDYVALLLFMRTLMPFVGLTPRLERIFRGEWQPDDEAFMERLRWVETRIMGEWPHQRATWAEALDAAADIRAMMGTTIDPQGLAQFAARCVAMADEPAPLAERDPRVEGEQAVLSMDDDVSWLAGPDGQKLRVGRASRRILRALAGLHRDRPGQTLTMWELLDVGWPGERPLPEAGANRVYVELNRLRKAGLREWIERHDAGYRLSPRLTVRIVAHPSAV